MDRNEQTQRRAAAKEFLESLNQLEGILHEDAAENEETTKLPDVSFSEIQEDDNLSAIDLDAFEDAVADIEQYMERRKNNEL
jgi:predicted nuclease of restriction endonuclease-like RecB superfamily